jgi:hypothetical protein
MAELCDQMRSGTKLAAAAAEVASAPASRLGAALVVVAGSRGVLLEGAGAGRVDGVGDWQAATKIAIADAVHEKRSDMRRYRTPSPAIASK